MRKETGSQNPRVGIVKALREHPEGLTLKDIAELTGSHRHTITKYVYELIGAKIILERDIGAAKLCYLMETYGGPEKMKGSAGFARWKGQAQLLTLLVALLLVPAGMIAAQSLGNATVTDGMAVAADGMDAGNASLLLPPEEGSLPQGESSEAASPEGQPADEVTVGDEPEPQTANGTLPAGDVAIDDENATEENATVEVPVSEINETLPVETDIPAEGNSTIEENATVTGNETTEEPVIVPAENETATEENETGPVEVNVTEPEINVTPVGSAAIEVFIESPERITRGQEFTTRVVIRNSGDAATENAMLEWILPDGFSIASGNAIETIGAILPGEEKFYDITVQSSISTARGANEIRARVSYG